METNLWVLTLLITLLTTIYLYITRNFNYWKNKGVPYLKPAPLFGNFFKVFTLKETVGEVFKKVYDYKDSKVTGFFSFNQPFLLLRDLDVIKQVLIKDFDYFDNRNIPASEANDKIGANLLFSLRNPAWRQVRIKLTPVFTTSKIKNMLALIAEVSEDLKTHIEEAISTNDGVIETKEMSMKFTTDIISSCVLGINSQSLKDPNSEIRAISRSFFTFTISRSIALAASFVAPGLVKLFRMKFMEPESSKIMCSIFLQHLHERKITNLKRGDLIDILLQIEKEDNESFDEDMLVAQALQFFLAGFETTGSALLYTLYELAVNQDVQHRLREEIQATVPNNNKLSYESIQEIKYLDAVFSEALRKYPSITFLDRKCGKNYKIPNTDVVVEKGTPVCVSLVGLHMDPRYFPEPDKFYPDRFLGENKKEILPFSYMPFGDGPRNCIGAKFALIASKLALISIISNFEIELHSSTPVPMEYDTNSVILLVPKGNALKLRFKRRT